jgi:glycerophosphoryl diester phosphodiesterase
MSGSVDVLEHEQRSPASTRNGGWPLVIAHRGAAADAPENTIRAFDLAWQQGADGIELDVHLASDDVPVVIHDPCLDRTTSGSGRVRDHSVQALGQFDAGSWFNERYRSKAHCQNARARIPLLSEALDWIRGHDIRAFVEIKEGGSVYHGIEAKVLKAISQAGVRDKTTVISFDLATLERCRQLDHHIALGIDVSRPLHSLANARSISAATLHPHWMFVSRRLVDCVHRAGIQVLVWGLDVLEPVQEVMASGVDGLITDYPARAVELRAELWRNLTAHSGQRLLRRCEEIEGTTETARHDAAHSQRRSQHGERRVFTEATERKPR